MKDIIEIEGLSKSYGKLKAVDGVSFKVKEGELFAFLGVNGAGKSTTISIMCGALQRDEGSVRINSCDIDSDTDTIKRNIGVVFQSSVLDRPLSVRANLESRAALYGIVGEDFKKRLSELTQLLDLGDILNRPVAKLSGGQRRRIDIARALLHRPKILILDEPTTGLDPQTRSTIWSVIEGLRKNENLTVFLTTHYMEEAADADYVVVIDGGKIVSEGTPHELKNRFVKDYVTLYGVKEADVLALSLPYEKLRDAYRIAVKDTAEAVGLIKEYPELFSDIEITKGKMDDVFLAVTGKNLSGGEEK